MVTWKLCPQAGFDTKNIFLELLLKIWSRYTKQMASDQHDKHEILRSTLSCVKVTCLKVTHF